MEEILIPMIAKCKIEESIPAMGIACKKGDIFMFNPYNEIHVALYDSDLFKNIPKDQCTFFCKYIGGLNLGKFYKYNEEIDTTELTEENLNDLCMLGYIKKVYNKTKTNSKKSVKNKTTKKPVSETYTSIARKFNKKSDEFKKAVFELTGIEIKDMRKKAPLKEYNKIIEALNK